MRRPACLILFIVLWTAMARGQAQQPVDRTQAGREIVVESGETVKDATCIGCSIRVRGVVEGDAVAVGGSVEVQGTVQGDAVAVGGSVTLGPASKVAGDAVAVIGRVERDPQASVGGEVSSVGGLPVAGLGTLILLGLLFSVVVNLVLALICFLVAGERRVETIAGTVRERAGVSLLAGLGVLAATAVLVSVSILIGKAALPLICVGVGLVLFVTLIVGYTGLSFWLGRSVARGAGPLAAVLLGVLLIHLIQAVPLVGFIAFPAFLLLALGGAVISGYGTAVDWMARQQVVHPAVPPAPPPVT